MSDPRKSPLRSHLDTFLNSEYCPSWFRDQFFENYAGYELITDRLEAMRADKGVPIASVFDEIAPFQPSGCPDALIAVAAIAQAVTVISSGAAAGSQLNQ